MNEIFTDGRYCPVAKVQTSMPTVCNRSIEAIKWFTALLESLGNNETTRVKTNDHRLIV